MARYIDADAIRITADKTFRDADGDLLVRLEDVKRAITQAETVDVQEVKHGTWHLIDDPMDDSGAPTERGLYRIIDSEGNEFTDYYYCEPTLIGGSVRYWRGGNLPIRAWARMEGEQR